MYITIGLFFATAYTYPYSRKHYDWHLATIAKNQYLLRPSEAYDDLEEPEAVVNLKALRVEVNVEHEHKQEGKVELSKTSTHDLLGK